MQRKNSLSDVYQTIISFGNYIHIQYLSNAINMEIDFGSDYDVDFQNHYGYDELSINSIESSDIVIISKYDKINIIENNERFVSFEIKLQENAYTILTIEL